jgi:amino acid transporter
MPQEGTHDGEGTGRAGAGDSPRLVRALGLLPSTALNIANMVGIGPFITIPIFLATMQGPQALLGWITAAVLVLCDGLVWSELGAALPGSGGTYHFLREIFGRYAWGRVIPFVFIWQFLMTGTLELASGYLGSIDYLKYIFPTIDSSLAEMGIPYPMSVLAAFSSLAILYILSRRIRTVGILGMVFCVGTLITVLIVIVTGIWHFDSRLIDFPEHAFRLDSKFAMGLGGAMLIALYDYFGYYNICYLGDEVKDPGRTIPRAVMLSVVIVAALYLTMNLAIIGVVPWREAMQSQNIAALFMERLFGRPMAAGFTWLIIWTAAASLFAGTLGCSRIPYAAAQNGDFFRVFTRVHPTKRFPTVSLFAVGVGTAICCFFSLQSVIEAAVTGRILIQFVGQIVALHILRTRRPDVAMPFRMWLYPLPSTVALLGWLYVLFSSGGKLILAALGIVVSGVLVFLAWKFLERRLAKNP